MSDLSHDKFGSVLIDGYNVGGKGFDRYRQMQRAGLALATKPGGAKAVVVAFGGGEGQGSPSGWVVAFDTAKLANGSAQADVWCSNPNNSKGPGGGGGVWMSNAAPAVDGNGDIYVVTGNGPYNPEFGADQLGESVVRLTWNPGNPGSLSVSDWFTPFLDADRDGAHKDQDLAAGGVVAMPDGTGLIVGGKDGVYYHVNRADMGKRDFSKLVDDPFVATFGYQPWNGHTSLVRRPESGHVDRPVHHRPRRPRSYAAHPRNRRVLQQDAVRERREQCGSRLLEQQRAFQRRSGRARNGNRIVRDSVARWHARRDPLAVGERNVERHPLGQPGFREPAERPCRQHRPDPEHPARLRRLDRWERVRCS